MKQKEKIIPERRVQVFRNPGKIAKPPRKVVMKKDTEEKKVQSKKMTKS